MEILSLISIAPNHFCLQGLNMEEAVFRSGLWIHQGHFLLWLSALSSHLSTYCDIHFPSQHLQTLTRAHTHMCTHQLSTHTAHDCSAHHSLLTADLWCFSEGPRVLCYHIFCTWGGEKCQWFFSLIFMGVFDNYLCVCLEIVRDKERAVCSEGKVRREPTSSSSTPRGSHTFYHKSSCSGTDPVKQLNNMTIY